MILGGCYNSFAVFHEQIIKKETSADLRGRFTVVVTYRNV